MSAMQADIASLMGQCSVEELNQILAQLEARPQATPPVHAPALPAAPPSGPPPTHGKRPQGNPRRVCQAPGVCASYSAAAQGGQAQPLTHEDVQRMLADHSRTLLSEVRHIVAAGNGQPQAALGGGGNVDAGALSEVIGARDREVEALEAQLADLTGSLQAKDATVETLNADMEQALRDVRHRQLDLEFHQQRLEEKVRTNAEMEQVQRKLTAQVEDASLNARHAVLNVETCRTPRGTRMQGSSPWTVRKNRPGAGNYM